MSQAIKVKEIQRKLWENRGLRMSTEELTALLETKKGETMRKVTIDYDPQTGTGAAFFEGSLLCDIVLPEAHAESIRELVAERIKETERIKEKK